MIAYVALGANLGDRDGNIHRAIEMLRASDQIDVLRESSFIENPAQGGPANSPNFLNAAIEVRTTLAPRELLDRLLEIERELGRIRGEKWSPRTIDLDLLLYNEEVIAQPNLSVPHPRMHERRFVLEPLAQIAPDALHPTLGATVRQLLQRVFKLN